jgi:hypothetical protein
MDVRCWTRTRIAGWMDGGAEQLCAAGAGELVTLHSDITNNIKLVTQCLPARLYFEIRSVQISGSRCQEPVANR